jgi:hypothetical protein
MARLDSQVPLAIGLSWFWRCFNSDLDKKTRASFVALTYGHTYAIIDLYRTEMVSHPVEREVKETLARILSADHLLKVTHDMLDARTLLVLQRGLIPNAEFNKDRLPPLQGVSPVLDMSVALAYVKRMQPCSPAVSKLMISVLNYLRVDMCMAENLSNFERRPLRLSQLHYALTLAWCPLMILRVLKTWNILSLRHLLPMVFQVGFPGAPDHWDDILRNTWMADPKSPPHLWPSKEACDALDPMQDLLEGSYGSNVWTHPEWLKAVPRPDDHFGVQQALLNSRNLEIFKALSLPHGSQSQDLANQVLSRLHEGTEEDLNRIYEVLEMARNARQGGS